MYPSHLGPGDRVDFVEPPADGPILGYSHQAVAAMRDEWGEPTYDERMNLYGYVRNNPVNMVDPSGLIGYGIPAKPQKPRKGPKMVCGFYAWLYAGSGVIPNLAFCVPEDVYQAALDAAAGVVQCWWDCEVTIHKSVLNGRAQFGDCTAVRRQAKDD